MANSMMVIDGSQSSKNETEKMQLDCLMEKLRSKNRRQKTAIEAIKIFHTVSNDRKSGFDLNLLHSQLNSLRCSINVGKASYTVDRLEAVSMECGVKFNSDISRGEAIFCCDIFSFRFSMNEFGNIGDVVITMNSESKSCPELLKALKAGNYGELKQHLDGLNSINDISPDKKIKGKIVMALQSLESDLNSLSMYQNSITSIQSYVHRSPLGILVPRIGGLLMKLIYFVGPYDLLNKKDKTSIPMTLEAIIERDVGYSLMVGIEKSPVNNRIQTSNLMLNNNSSDGKNLPIFAPLNNSNSCSLPVQFVVSLKEPLVLSWTVICKIQNVTGIKMTEVSLLKPVVSLLVDQLNHGKKNSQNQSGYGTALVVMPSKGTYLCFQNPINNNLMGCMVDKIAFTHPTHLPTIVAQLRQQILFNTLISSCIKSMAILSPQNMKEFTSREIQFEVVPLSLQLITATFQHPLKESLLTIMLELNDSISVTCKMTGEHVDLVASNDYVTKVTQRCLSLPVVIRSIFKRSPPTRNRQRDLSGLPPLIHLSRQTSCLLPCPDASLFSKKYVASKSLDSIGECQAEERSSIKISVPKLLANFSIPPRMPIEDGVVVKLEQDVNQENEPSGSNVPMQHNLSVSSSSHLSVLQIQEARAKKEMLSKSGESDIEIIEKPSLIPDASVIGRQQSMHQVHKVDKVSSNPMLASLLDHSSSTSNLSSNNNQNMMGVNMNLNANNKHRKRTANDWGPGNPGGRNSKKTKTTPNILSDEYFGHHFQHMQQHQLVSRNQMPDSGMGVKINSNCQTLKMSETERSLAVMARQMSDPTSFQNFAAWQNSTSNTNIGGLNVSMPARQQSVGMGTFYDKDAAFPPNHQNRVPPKDGFKSGSTDALNINSCGNSKQFSSADADWEVKIEPSTSGSMNAGVMSKSSLTIEKQPPIKMRFDKRSFTSASSNNNDVGRPNNQDSGIASSSPSSGSSDTKRQMSSSLTDLLSDDNNHSNSADSEVGILTSGRDSVGAMTLNLGSNASRCSSSPRLPIKRIGDSKDAMEARGGMLNPSAGLVGGQHPPLKKLKPANIGKNSEEKKAKRAYSCAISLDDATKQKLSKKQRIYEFDDDECIVTASTSPIASQVPSGTPTVKITNTGGKFKLQNSLKSKQIAVGLGGMAAGRQGQLSAMMASQKTPKPFGSHHIQGHHPRLNKTAVRPKSIDSKLSGGLDSRGLSRTPSQTFVQNSQSPITIASTSPFQMPSPVNQSQYQQTKFKPPQCTMPMSFSSVNANSAPLAVTTSKFNSSASSRSSNAAVPTNVKSKSPSASGELKQGASKKALNSVIDTLKKKQANGADGSRVLDGPVAQKEIYDAIRLEIIREGNKPSTPTRDQLVASSSKLNNQKKMNSDNSSLQSRNANVFQTLPKNQIKTAPSKSPSPNNFSSSLSQGSLNSASKPVVAVSTLSTVKANSKSDVAMTKPTSFNSGFSSSSPNSTFSSSVSAPQMFLQSRSMMDVSDVATKSSVPSSLPMLSPSILPPASNSLLGFNSRAASACQNQRSSVLSSQMIGARYQEKSPMKMQLPYNSQDVAMKMMKLNDISEKLSRHFLDVVSNVDSPGTSTSNSPHVKTSNSSVNNAALNISGNSNCAPVVERLLSPPRSPSPGLGAPVQLADSTSCSPHNKTQAEEPKDQSCVGPCVPERADEFGIQKGKTGSVAMPNFRTNEVSPGQISLEIQARAKPQRCQSRDFGDVVTVDDEKCETPDNDLVIDVSPSSSPVEATNKTTAVAIELTTGNQNSHLLPMPANAAASSSAYLLDLTNSPPSSSVQSEAGDLPASLPSRPSSAWVHKSPPSMAAMGQKSQPSSVNSVMCELDDDLMNEALIM